MNITKKNRELLANYLKMSLTNSPLAQDLSISEDENFQKSAREVLSKLYDNVSVSEGFVKRVIKSGLEHDTLTDLPYVIEHDSPTQSDLKAAKFLLEGSIFLDIGVRIGMAENIEHAIEQRGVPVFEAEIAGSVARRYTIDSNGVKVSLQSHSKVTEL